jgi:sugar (pentulose or hexulose) kinase
MHPEPVILIFDVGKTNKKYCLINEQYHIVFSRSVQLPESVDDDGFPCEDLQLLIDWVSATIASVFNLTDYQIKAINFSAYGASFVHLDKDGKPVTQLYNYLKPYPESLSNQFYKLYGSKDGIALQTCSPVLGSLNSGMQLYRLKYEQPEIFSRIAFSLHMPQYLSYLVSGKLLTEITSIGCHTQLWNFKNNAYDDWVINEGLDDKFPPLVPSCSVHKITIHNQLIAVGAGLHDSSAALLPYLIGFSEPFALISTGTWCISFNPINNSPLTIEELRQDCLSYLSYQGKPVKASRLFTGQYHDTEARRIAEYFNQGPDFYKTILFNKYLIPDKELILAEQKISEKRVNIESIDCSQCTDADSAYHHLVLKIVIHQIHSTQLILNNAPVNKIFVDGGFSKNEIYIHLLALLFPAIEVYAASFAQASALGAALAVHSSWNKQPLPPGIVELRKIHA